MFELLAAVPLIGGAASYVIPFLVVLTLVVFVHEMGHYLVARWRGIGARVFSVGFGPEIFGWTDRRGTRWRFSWIPLGGYVQFEGDSDPASVTEEARARAMPGTFQAASLWSRFLVVLAGPAMNFLFAIVVFTLIALADGQPGRDAVVGAVYGSGQSNAVGLEEGDRILSVNGAAVEDAGSALQALQATAGAPVRVEVIRDGARTLLEGQIDQPVQIGRVISGSAAERAGLEVGDVVRAVDGDPIRSFAELRQRVLDSEGAEMKLEVERDGRLLILFASPANREVVDSETGAVSVAPVLGVGRKPFEVFRPAREQVGLGEAVTFGVVRTVAIVTVSLWFVGDLIAGEGDTGDLGGPIAIAEFSGDAAKRGAWDFFNILGVISASIGLINLFPIPVLDGGHLVLFALEAIRGRPLGARASRYLGWLGLSVIMMLMVFVTYNDIVRF